MGDLLSSQGGGSGGVAVQDETAPVAVASTLNFTGGGVVASDAGGGLVNVTISGASPSAPIVEYLSGEGGVDPAVPINPLDDVAHLTNTAGDAQLQDFTLADSAVDGHQIKVYNVGGNLLNVVINGGSQIEMPGGNAHLGLTWSAGADDWVSDTIELADVNHDATLVGQGQYNTPLSARSVLGDASVAAGGVDVDSVTGGPVIIDASGSPMKFFDAIAPVTRPVVAGSRALGFGVGGAGLSLLAALTALGLITDSTVP